MTNYYENQPR